MKQGTHICFACRKTAVGRWQNSFEFMCFNCMDEYELTIVKDVYPQPEEMCRPSQNGMAFRKAKTSGLEANEGITNSVQRVLIQRDKPYGSLLLEALLTTVPLDISTPKE